MVDAQDTGERHMCDCLLLVLQSAMMDGQREELCAGPYVTRAHVGHQAGNLNALGRGCMIAPCIQHLALLSICNTHGCAGLPPPPQPPQPPQLLSSLLVSADRSVHRCLVTSGEEEAVLTFGMALQESLQPQ